MILTLDKSQEISNFDNLTNIAEPVVEEALKSLASILKQEWVKKETIDKAIQTYFEKLLWVDKIDVNRLLSDNRIWINKEKQTAMAVVDGKKYVVPVSTLLVITKLFNKALLSRRGIAYLPKNSCFIGTADNRTEEEIKKAQSSRYYIEIDKEKFNA